MPTTSPPANAGKKQAGRFKPGQSGNPKGKRPGTLNKATMNALILMEGQLEAITAALVEAALAGDMSAIKLVLERTVPPCRERTLPPLKLPAVETAEDLPKLTQAILGAVAAGQITPTEGERLAGLVAAHGKALELCELEKRIAALEAGQEAE